MAILAERSQRSTFQLNTRHLAGAGCVTVAKMDDMDNNSARTRFSDRSGEHGFGYVESMVLIVSMFVSLALIAWFGALAPIRGRAAEWEQEDRVELAEAKAAKAVIADADWDDLKVNWSSEDDAFYEPANALVTGSCGQELRTKFTTSTDGFLVVSGRHGEKVRVASDGRLLQSAEAELDELICGQWDRARQYEDDMEAAVAVSGVDVRWDPAPNEGWVTGDCGIAAKFSFTLDDSGDLHALFEDDTRSVPLTVRSKPAPGALGALTDLICSPLGQPAEGASEDTAGLDAEGS